MSKDERMRPKLAIEKRGKAPKEMQKITRAIKDLANGNKHMKLDKANSEKRVVGAVDPSGFKSSFYSYFFGPHFGIPIGTSYYIFQLWRI